MTTATARSPSRLAVADKQNLASDVYPVFNPSAPV